MYGLLSLLCVIKDVDAVSLTEAHLLPQCTHMVVGFAMLAKINPTYVFLDHSKTFSTSTGTDLP